MATTSTRTASPRRDLRLIFWTEETTEGELRAAFRSRSQWVVASLTSLAGQYAVVLGNLLCRPILDEHANIEQVRQALQRGLNRSAFDRLKGALDISAESLAAVLRVPTRTIARREVFKPDESERILRVAVAFQRSLEVLGDLAKARHWFSTPKRALGDKTPLEYCDTEPGAEEVVHLLGRIEHGVFS